MKPFGIVLGLLASPLFAETAPPMTCAAHKAFVAEMAAKGAYITMAEVVRDGSDRRLEAYYQADQCIWTLAIVQLGNGQVRDDSPTCLIGEGDPGVCIPKK